MQQETASRESVVFSLNHSTFSKIQLSVKHHTDKHSFTSTSLLQNMEYLSPVFILGQDLDRIPFVCL